MQLKEYTEEVAAVRKVRDWVSVSVSAGIKQGACKGTDDLRKWYQALRTMMTSTADSDVTWAQETYTNVIACRTKPRDWNEWLRRWEDAVEWGKAHSIPEVATAGLLVAGLKGVVSPFFPQFSLLCSMKYGEAIRTNNLPSFRVLSALVREEIARAKDDARISGGRVGKGAFNVQLADDDQISATALPTPTAAALPAAAAAPARASQSAAQKSGRGRKRKHDDDEDSCPACLRDGHPLSDCWYVFPEKAIERFRPRAALKERVEKRIARPPVKGMLERLEKRQRTNDSPSDK